MKEPVTASPLPRKSWSYLLIAAGLIMIPALTFAVSADLPHIPLFCLLGLLASLAVRKPIPYSDRTVIYTLVVAVVTAVMFNLVFPMRDNRLGYISLFFYPNLLVPFLLYSAIGTTLFESSRRGFGVIAASSLVSLMLGGDVFYNSAINERLPLATPLFHHINGFYGVMVGMELVLLLAGLFWGLNGLRPTAVSPVLRRRRLLLRVAGLAVLPLLAGTIVGLYVRYDNTIRSMENYLLRVGVRRLMPAPGRIQFDKQVNLTFTMIPEMVKNQDEIVFRAKSSSAPGYLRAQCYTRYQQGTWKTGRETGLNLKNRHYGGMIAYTSFYLGADPDAPKHRIDIFPQSRFASEMLLLPGNFRRIDIIADHLEADANGTVAAKEWVRDGGYSCFVPTPEDESAWPEPTDPAANPEYLEIPSELLPALDQIWKEILPARRTDGRLADQETILRLVHYLQTRFRYALDWRFSGPGDPIAWFLLRHRQAHCELFASSAALLLRRHGIPTRYLAGFICEEKHPSGTYYVSRLGNAHAWVEAWDRDRHRWALVESTPPAGLTAHSRNWGGLSSWKDRFYQFFQETLTLLRRGVIATAILGVFTGLGGMTAELLGSPWRLGAVVLLALGAGVWLWRRYRRRRVKAATADQTRQTLQRYYLAWEKRWTAAGQRPRAPGETVDEFLDRLDRTAALTPAGRELLADYRKLRYSASPPSLQAVEEWARRAAAVPDWRNP